MTLTTPPTLPLPAAVATAIPITMDDPEIYAADMLDLVAREKKKMRARRWATQDLDREEAADSFKAPVVRTLTQEIADPPKALKARIEGFSHVGANTLVNAQYKAGKTTLALNRVRSLVDRTPFLGEFDVLTPLSGNAVYLNYELSESQFHAWSVGQGIRNTDRFIPVHLRGTGCYIQEDAWAEWLIGELKARECEVLEFDPLAAGLKGTAISDEVASDFLNRLDQIKKEAGVSDLFLTAHTGHLRNRDSSGQADNERTLGSSRWMGWADGWWTLTKDASGIRYLSAEGRDVERPEFSLTYDKPTHHLSVGSLKTSRANAAVVAKTDKVVEFVTAHAGCTQTAVLGHIGGTRSKQIAFLDQMETDGFLTTSSGARGAKNYSLGPAFTWAMAKVEE